MSWNKEVQLTENFKFKEFIVSSSYPDYVEKLYNTVDQFQFNIYTLCHFIMQPLRNKFKIPLFITSGYRDEFLNEKVGGTKNSNHLTGRACDFTVAKLFRVELFRIYKFLKEEMRYELGEIILYRNEDNNPEFIHVGLPMFNRKKIVAKVP